jgi:hypothetical protein
LSIGFLLAPAQAWSQVTLLTGVNLVVDDVDNVTVTSSGTPTFFGDNEENAGPAGSFGFINGWGVSAGQVEWEDNNRAIVARLNSSGVQVLVAFGSVRSGPGPADVRGSVSVTASPILGASLRQTFGVGVHPYTSTVARPGGHPIQFSGTVTILVAPPKVTIINGLFLEVESTTGAVTVLSSGNPVLFGDVGDAGDLALLNGWSMKVGDEVVWFDGGPPDEAASLDFRGLHVPVSGRMANSTPFSLFELSASPLIGLALANQFGVGQWAFDSQNFAGSKVAQSPTTRFYLEGTAQIVTDPCVLLGGDSDGDTLCDDQDPCMHFFNTLPLVTHPSGIPCECLCGDFDGDCFHSATDAAAVNDCSAFLRSDCVSDRDEVAPPFDTFYSATDADLINRVSSFLDPAYTLTCERRPEGTCGGATGVACF